MKIEWTKIDTNFQGERCFVHARGVILDNGFGLMTTQPLRFRGSDMFYGIYLTTTSDGGKTWSELKPSKTLDRRDIGGGVQITVCDATPMYHKKTGKILLLGHNATYLNDEKMPPPIPRYTVYAVYDEAVGDFSPFEFLEMPKEESETYFSCGNGSGQSLELDNGELLIPVYYTSREQCMCGYHANLSSCVLRCAFDGEKLSLLEIGNALTKEEGSGLCEPSVVRYNGEYFLSLRNNKDGYVTKGTDGLHYQPETPLVFDDGESVGNYNTQQHWITGGGKLYLVYTRRGANNDHVFRHRAPLFIAEFDTKKMCLIRSTEQVVVPNRGARLGNFGCQSLDEKHAVVFAAEWMQTLEPNYNDWKNCMKYGSDNSIFISHIEF